jgi:hypothetical protein
MIARAAPPPMRSVYDGRDCIGFIITGGPKGHEAFDVTVYRKNVITRSWPGPQRGSSRTGVIPVTRMGRLIVGSRSALRRRFAIVDDKAREVAS